MENFTAWAKNALDASHKSVSHFYTKRILVLCLFSMMLIGLGSCSSNKHAHRKPTKAEKAKLYRVNKRKSNASKWGILDKHADCPDTRTRKN